MASLRKLTQVLLILSATAGLNCQLTFDPSTGTYNDLVVGFSERTLPAEASQQDKEQLILKTEEMLQEASEALFEASKGHVQIGSAKLLVPVSWNYPGAEKLQLRFARADIRVDAPSPQHGELPYTHQPHACGVQGRYIHVTPRFVEEDQEVIEITGNRGRALVHEWAQFRWGVREEYGHPGDTLYPYFHRDPQGNWVPTGSNTSQLAGQLRTVSGSECSFNEIGQPSKDCRFFPDNTISASLMHFHHLDTPLLFSTVDDNNRLSPSKQISLCDLRSSWEVLEGHSDFSANPAPSPGRVQTTVAQTNPAPEGALYIVIDLSTSTIPGRGDEIMLAEKKELVDFFSTHEEEALVSLHTYEGWMLSAFEDSYEFKELMPLGPLGPRRSEFINAVNSFQLNKIDQRDVYQALFNISEYAQNVTGGNERGVVFITQNHRGTEPETLAIDALQAANLAVIGVGYIEYANAPNLFNVCTSTGGRSFIVGYPLDTGFRQALDYAALGNDFSQRQYIVAQDSAVLSTNESRVVPVYIEPALGRDTTFALGYKSYEPILTHPNGTVIPLDPPICIFDGSLQLERHICFFENATGEWTVEYNCPDTCDVNEISWLVSTYAHLTAEEDSADIYPWPLLTVWTSGTDGVVNLTREDLLVYAQIATTDYRPLVNAYVTGSLSIGGSDVGSTQQLRDDGREPDVVAGDGVYSGKMRPVSSFMYLSVHVAYELGNTALLRCGPHPESSGWGILPVNQNTTCCGSEQNGFEADSYNMQRALADFLTITVLDINDYQLRPQIIEDLWVVSRELISDTICHIKVAWTAPHARDETSDDKVKQYELYYSPDQDTILDDLTSSTLVTSDSVTSEDDLVPLTPGSRQEVTVIVTIDSGYMGPVFFRIRSLNKDDLESKPSRAVYVNLEASQAIETTTSAFSTTSEDPFGDPPPPGKKPLIKRGWFIALLVLLALAILVAAVVVIWRYSKRRQNKLKQRNSVFSSTTL